MQVKTYERSETKTRLNNEVTQSAQISKGGRHSCRLSPTLFDVYLNGIISEWNGDNVKGYKSTSFVDDQVVVAVVAASDTILQRYAHILENIPSNRTLIIIATNKTKTVTSRERHPSEATW